MKVNIDIRILAIALLVVALFFSLDGCSRINNLLDGSEIVSEKTETKTEYKTKPKTEYYFDNFVPSFVPSKQTVLITGGIVQQVKPNYILSAADLQRGAEVKEVNKYERQIILPNGIINSTILSTGDVLAAEYVLTTFDTETTTNTTTTKIVAKSGLFGFGGTTLGLNGRIKNVQAGVEYVHKNSWLVAGGLQYDLIVKQNYDTQDRTGIFVKLGFKI